MKKKRMAQKKLPGIEAMASLYTMNTRPSPSIPTSLTLRPWAEQQVLSWQRNFAVVFTIFGERATCLHLRHVSQHAEDDEARHEAGDAVDCAEQEQERLNIQERGKGGVTL